MGTSYQDPASDRVTSRFWPKVQVTGFCWEWIANINRSGYGLFYNGNKMVSAHRYAYEILVGPIPDGLSIDHLCRNTRCVNPDHMECVTISENAARAHRVRRRKACPQGHPMEGGNVILDNRNGHECRTCVMARKHERRAALRAAGLKVT